MSKTECERAFLCTSARETRGEGFYTPSERFWTTTMDVCAFKTLVKRPRLSSRQNAVARIPVHFFKTNNEA